MRPMDMLNDPELARSGAALKTLHKAALLAERRAQERDVAGVSQTSKPRSPIPKSLEVKESV